jgi:hypothetical protein
MALKKAFWAAVFRPSHIMQLMNFSARVEL